MILLVSRHKTRMVELGGSNPPYLNLGQPEKAKIHLGKLDSICFFGCDEYTTLKKAIEDYEKTKVVKNY